MGAEVSLSGVVLLPLNTQHNVTPGVLIIISTCKDKRSSGNHDNTVENQTVQVVLFKIPNIPQVNEVQVL